MVFQTENEVLSFASSGSGGMESAVANLTRPGEPALVVSCGKFGERWAELCEAYGADLIHHDSGWGEKVEPAELDRLLGENSGVEVVFTTLSETSTGVVNDVKELTEVAHRHGALIAVDAVSGLGAVPIPQDEWGVDVVVVGLAEGADDAAGPGLREPQRGRDGPRRERAAPRLLLRLAEDRRRPAQGPARLALHPGREHLDGARRGAGDDRGRGPGAGLRAPPAARPRRARRRGRAGARSVRPRGRGRQRGHRDHAAGLGRRRQGAQDHARQVRRHHRRRPGQAEGQDRPHRPLRLLRRVRHRHHDRRVRDDPARAGRDVELGAGVGAAQRVFLEAGVPVAAPA